jgi:hypothetical protein
VAAGLLTGDAATRVIMAYHLGRGDPMSPRGSAFRAQVLAEALDDPYAAVRFVAARSLSSQSGFEALDFDFTAAPATLNQSAAVARTLAARGGIDPLQLQALKRQRDPRPIRISE